MTTFENEYDDSFDKYLQWKYNKVVFHLREGSNTYQYGLTDVKINEFGDVKIKHF